MHEEEPDGIKMEPNVITRQAQIEDLLSTLPAGATPEHQCAEFIRTAAFEARWLAKMVLSGASYARIVQQARLVRLWQLIADRANPDPDHFDYRVERHELLRDTYGHWAKRHDSL